MARKNVNSSFNSFDNVSLATDQVSEPTDMTHLDNVGIIVDWTGASPLGEIVVEATNDVDPVQQANWTWVRFDFGNTITITGAVGSHLINIAQAPFNKIRIRYIRASGTGTLTATVTIKQIGG